MTTQHPIFKTSAEAVRLKRRLLELQQGSTITYQEIRDLIGFDPQGDRGRGICETAIRQIRRESLHVWKCVRGVGYKHLSDDEIPDAGSESIQRIRREANKGAQISVCADVSKMAPERKIQHLCNQTRFAVISRTTSAAAQKKLETEVASSNRLLECAEATRAMFK